MPEPAFPVLRPVRDDDRDRLLAWRNLPEVARWMYSDHTITPEKHARWFAAAMADPARAYWVIHDGPRDLGLANLTAIDRAHRRAHWAFYIADPAARGKGIGGLVEFCVITHAFEGLGLDKLCCEVLAANPAVIELHKKFGFVQEGLFRRHVLKQGVAHDVVALALLRDDWEPLREPTRQRLQRIFDRSRS